MAEWNYGDAYKRHPVKDTVVFDNGSVLKVHDIFDPLPEFMRQADLIFVDPPWNLGNLNTFYTKAERNDYQSDFDRFLCGYSSASQRSAAHLLCRDGNNTWECWSH